MIASAGSGCAGSYVSNDCYHYGKNRSGRINLAAKVSVLAGTLTGYLGSLVPRLGDNIDHNPT
jgi:hypothetical protein